MGDPRGLVCRDRRRRAGRDRRWGQSMTAPGTPAGEPDVASAKAVASLVREVDALRRALDALRELPARVDELTRLTVDLTDAVAALTNRKANETCPSWLMLPADPAHAAGVLDELAAWMTAVYLRYADAGDALPECWCFHPDIVEELLWLLHAWSAAYQGPQASVALVGDWHDRQRPGVVRRVRQSAGSCSIEAHVSRAGWSRRPSAAPEVPGVGHLPSVAAWWGARRDEAAPEPVVAAVRDGVR